MNIIIGDSAICKDFLAFLRNNPRKASNTVYKRKVEKTGQKKLLQGKSGEELYQHLSRRFRTIDLRYL